MKSRFWFFGGLVSVCVHALVLVLFVFCFGDWQTMSEADDSAAEEAVQTETEEAAASVSSSGNAPSSSIQSETPAQTAPQVRTETSARTASAGEYQVRAGDTLVAIARRVGCTVAQLAEANKSDVKKLSRLRIGQRLTLPAESGL